MSRLIGRGATPSSRPASASFDYQQSNVSGSGGGFFSKFRRASKADGK
jgi:hypothetical protein